MSTYLIDTHCHLHDPEFYTPEQAEDCLKEAHQNGVEQIIVIGTSHADSLKAQSFAAAHDNVFWTYGIHPEEASNYQTDEARADFINCDNAAQNEHVAFFELALSSSRESPTTTGVGRSEQTACDDRPVRTCFEKNDKANLQKQNMPCAIGEVGLDYHYNGYDRTAQIRLFEQMLQLARDLDLPVSLHIREAFADVWPIIDNFPGTRGVVHSFTGNKRELGAALDRNFYIGINGLATYSTLPLPPIEKIVLETDAPFLTPIPFRGTMNKPGYVRFVADFLSEKMGVAKSDLVEQTTQNARQLFNLRYPILRSDEV